MAKFKKDEEVVQIMPAPISGRVAGFHADQTTGDLQLLVVWKDENGDEQSRYFTEEQLESKVVPAK
jgi:hypothetical protein